MDGFAFAMARSMTSSAGLDKDLLFKIFLILITRSMKMELLFVLRL